MRNLKAIAAVLSLAVALCPAPAAEKTRSWRQISGADFAKGDADRIAVGSDGVLTLAPRIVELFATPDAYLGAIATDSKSNIFVSGGPDARVFRIPADVGGESAGEIFFEADAVDIRALAFDANDNLYAAVSPEAKVYRIAPDGEAGVIYAPDCNYIWAMAFDSQQRLYLATGDKGEIHRIDVDGEGGVYFETGETHVRSLAIDEDDNLIVGTDPGGLLMRIADRGESPAQGFVLYQSPRAEITAIVHGRDGVVYAAGVGDRTPPGRRTTRSAPTVRQAAPPTQNPSAAARQPTSAIQSTRTTPAALLSRVVGGSSIYAIAPDGEPRKIWDSPQAIVYSLGLDAGGRLLAGTGDAGRLMRIDSDTRSTILTTRDSKQITALASSNGRIVAASSNAGTVFAVGPELADEGVFESEVHDATGFSRFGRVEWKGAGDVALYVRSGNLKSPERNWSAWHAAPAPDGGVTGVPGARFVQWKAALRAKNGAAPELRSTTLYYQPKNSAPRVAAVETTPPHYRFPIRPPNARSANITLPPLGANPSGSRPSPTSRPTLQSMAPARGHIGVRWNAEDANKDTLRARLEIQGETESTWILIEEKIEAAHHSWDSTSFADGWYRARVTVSDELSNPGPEALSGSKISEPFLIDNSAPVVTQFAASVADGRLRIAFSAKDAASKIAAAEYSLNGGDWKLLAPVNGLYDASELDFDFDAGPAAAGQHVAAVRVRDSQGNLTAAKTAVVSED